MEFLRHVELLDNSKFNDSGTSYTEKIAIHFANLRDKHLLQSIIAFALREGITDLYLLDEEFVKTALIDKKTAIEKVIEALNPSAIKAIQAKTAIEKIPNADVAEVKHGMWLHKNGEMICSVCGGEALMDEVYYKSPFCPDCGAKMDGRGDGDDL